jgi:hypothetical protein
MKEVICQFRHSPCRALASYMMRMRKALTGLKTISPSSTFSVKFPVACSTPKLWGIERLRVFRYAACSKTICSPL